MNYCERIRAIREDRDLPQKEVALLLGVGQRTYSDYESGKTRIPVERLIMLAEYYNVDMNYICGITNIAKPFPNE